MKIYLAGPDVFLPDALEIGRRKAAICARHGVSGLYPLDNAVDLAAGDASLTIFKGNEAMMDAADAIIANLTPFRGPSADAGTVYELGYMAGRGKLCLAYSNDPSPYAGARRRAIIDVKASPDGRLIDPDGLTVEDFGLPDNLMMIHALDLHGCPLVTPRSARRYLARPHLFRGLRSPGGGSQRRANRVRALAKSENEPTSPASARTCCWSSAACSKAGHGRARRSRPALVIADGKPVAKASETIAADAALSAQPAHPYVSRGGVKLAGALEQYPIEIEDHVCLDVGASTGGFTEVLLANGASLVFAIDVGRGQLHPSLHGHPKIVSMEETDIRNFEGRRLPARPDIVVIDVSFISLKAVLPVALALAAAPMHLLALIKPQFEAQRKHSKRGIIRNAMVHQEICDDIAAFAASLGCTDIQVFPSSITGGDGNIEFFIGARRG